MDLVEMDMMKMDMIKKGLGILSEGKGIETISNAADQLTQAAQGNAEFKDAGSFESWQWSQPNFGLNMNNLKSFGQQYLGIE